MSSSVVHRLSGVRHGGQPRALELPVPPVWHGDALCAQTDPEAFFPDRGGDVRPAKRICAHCQVTAKCLAYAIEHHPLHGVWGGTSARERRDLVRQARRAPAPVAVRAGFDEEVARRTRGGATAAQIAVRLGVTNRTVHRARRRIRIRHQQQGRGVVA